ncbi:glycosyltransferase [Patescibacteria group bacterium]|nr:glycosyltransferase [Patescibacteria group bacterium]
MKIIYLANARIPTEKAHGLQIMKMCEAFKNQGVDVELVVANRKDNQLEHIKPFQYYGIKNEFEIKKLWLLDIVAMGRSFKGLSVPIQNTSFALSALRYLANKKPDIIYSRDEFSSFFLSLFKKNIVFELHTFPQSKFTLYKMLFKRCKRIVVITKSLKKLLVDQLEIDDSKIMVAPDGVSIYQFDIDKSKKECRQYLEKYYDYFSQEKNIILYTGHLFRWKGVFTLAESAKYLSNKELIVFVGGMEHDRARLNNYIDKNGLSNVKSIRHQSPTMIPIFLRAADVVVLPNSKEKQISVKYTSPMKLFEYMAAKKPVVASDLQSIREILDTDNSVLVKSDDPKALSDGIKKLLNDKNLVNSIVSHAYLDVKEYTWQKRAKNILIFIK